MGRVAVRRRLDIGTTAEQHCCRIIVRRGERKHDCPCTRWVNSDSIGYVIEWSLLVLLIIKEHGCPIRLDQKLARRKEPRERVEISGKCLLKNRRRDGGSPGREELIRRIVLTSVIHITSISTATNLQNGIRQKITLGSRVMILTIIIEPSSRVSLRVRVNH